MGAEWGQSGGSVPPCELSTDAVFAGDPMLIIRGQSAEGQGRPVDANGRHAPCKLFLPKKVYKKGAGLCPLKYNQSAATIMPCCTNWIAGDHISVGRFPSFNILKGGDDVFDLVKNIQRQILFIERYLSNDSKNGTPDCKNQVEQRRKRVMRSWCRCG
jgi:hypothetical protein